MGQRSCWIWSQWVMRLRFAPTAGWATRTALNTVLLCWISLYWALCVFLNNFRWDCEAKASMKETGLVSMLQERAAFLSILIKDNQEFVFRWEMMMMEKYCTNSPISRSCFWNMIYDHAAQEVGRSFLGHFQGTIHFFLSLSISISSVSPMFPTGKDTTSFLWYLLSRAWNLFIVS